MNLSIIIVNYRSQEKLTNCLRSIETSDLSGLSFEVVVVENNSGDKLIPLINEFPFARLINSNKNLGMGGGNNLGIKYSTGELILVSNPDIVFKPQSIKILVEQFKKDSNIGLIGPKLLNPDGTLQYSCARFPRWYMPILRRTFLGNYFKKSLEDFSMRKFNHQSNLAVDWLFGACLLVDRKDIKKQKLFDERFFMYFEDTDLCRRIWKSKKTVLYCADSEVYHDHQRESANKNILSNRILRTHIYSWWKYFLKWGFSCKR